MVYLNKLGQEQQQTAKGESCTWAWVMSSEWKLFTCTLLQLRNHQFNDFKRKKNHSWVTSCGCECLAFKHWPKPKTLNKVMQQKEPETLQKEEVWRGGLIDRSTTVNLLFIFRRISVWKPGQSLQQWLQLMPQVVSIVSFCSIMRQGVWPWETSDLLINFDNVWIKITF